MTVSGSGQGRAYRLFVSYSHRNEAQRDRLLTHLAPLQHTGLIAQLWHDRAIDAGSDWREAIKQAMEQADGAIFLLCPDFLASKFCLDEEVPPFLQRQRDEGALLLYVLGKNCGWTEYEFISPFQIIPRDNRPVSKFRDRSEAYTLIQREIKQALLDHQAQHGRRRATAAVSERDLDATGFASLPNTLRCGFSEPANPGQPEALARLLAKLPGHTAKLFGRDGELQRLDAWHGHKGVWLWVAEGGYGKSALVHWWLERRAFDPATRFLGQSFYSQGSHNQATSARPFLLAALAAWHIAHAIDAPDAELGRLLAQAAAQSPSLIVLDGLEPLQQAAPADARLHGIMRDQGLAALLAGLAQTPGQALCLATSRLPLPDAAISRSAYFRQETLPGLSPADAQDLLAQRGVVGAGRARDWPADVANSSRAWPAPTGGELAQMAERCGHHPLALVLAAEFCHSFLDDSAAAFLARPWTMSANRAHAATVMAWFDDELAQERQNLDRDLARVLGLFDRPAPWAALLALQQQAPPIPGLTAALHRADQDELLEALARLKQWGMLDADLARPAPDLDAHPLVREHFGGQLERDNPPAFRAAHRLLFDWFRYLPDKYHPDSLEEMEPLYRAMWHGCKAGAYWTALKEIYFDRIQREQTAYSLFQLGAYSSDLAALTYLFPDGWAEEPVKGEGEEVLDEKDRSWLLGQAAFCLMALGRMTDALMPRRAGRQIERKIGEWARFCNSSENLVDLLTTLGRWTEADEVVKESMIMAVQIIDKEERWPRSMCAHSRRGRLLHGQGRLTDANVEFVQAECLWAQALPEMPLLSGLSGFDCSEFLLDIARQPEDWREVLERGRYGLKIDSRDNHLPSVALHHCTIGLALSALGEAAEASAALDLAVATMQRASANALLPIMHLARARHRRRLGDLAGVWADHDAALRIAAAGAMRTYLADAALLVGQLHLDSIGRPGVATCRSGFATPTETFAFATDAKNVSGGLASPAPLEFVPKAAAQHARAAAIIHADGYGRRLAELHLLDARLRHYQHDPKAARAALQAAEARLRAIGQWGLWRALQETAAELGLPVPVIEYDGE